MGVVFAYAIIFIINPIVAGGFMLYAIGHTVQTNKFLRNTAYPACLAATMAYIGYWSHHGAHISDIDRYMIFAQEYKGKSLQECIDIRYTGLYTYDLFQWLCAKFQDQRVMVVAEVFIIYFVASYVIISMADYHKLNRKQTCHCLILSLTILPFFNQITYMRSAIATSLIVLAVCRDLMENKRDVFTFLMYAAGVTFHQAAWVFVLLRIFLHLFEKNLLISSIGIFGVTAIIGTGTVLLKNMVGPLGSLIDMANGYATGAVSQTSWALGLSRSIYNQISRITFGVLLIVCLVSVLRGQKRISEKGFAIYRYFVVCGSFCLGTYFFSMPVYERYEYCMIPFMSVILYIDFVIHSYGAKKTAIRRYIPCAFALMGISINVYLLYANIDIKLLLASITQGFLLSNILT